MKDKANWETTQTLPVADHKPHTLPAGVYEFFIQNEYNPSAQVFQKVLD
jgi:hypothetical protein